MRRKTDVTFKTLELTFRNELGQPSEPFRIDPSPRPAPEPVESACCYLNGYGSSATTRLKDLPHGIRRPGQHAVDVPGVGAFVAVGSVEGHHLPRAGWISMSLLEWLRKQRNHPARGLTIPRKMS